jgi:hypothetical protein
MKYSLGSLMIVVTVGPPLLALVYWGIRPHIIDDWRHIMRVGPPGWVDDGGEIYYFPK